MLETNTVMNNVPLLTAFASAERDTYAQLREQQQLLGVSPMVKTLLAAIPEIVLILNQQRQIVFANETCLNIFGVQDFGQMIGKRPGELLSCTHSDEMPGGCGTSEFCRTCGAVRAF